MLTNGKFSMDRHPKNIGVIISRFLVCIMMHFVVEPDIKCGIEIMKYTVNHPSKFKSDDKKNPDKKINFMNVYIAFFLGLC